MPSSSFLHLNLSRRSSVEWTSLLVRIALSLFLISCLVEVVRAAVGALYARSSTIPNVERARLWDPSNPVYPAQLAGILPQVFPVGLDPRTVPLFEDAVRLSPNRAESWEDLATALEAAGDMPGAEFAYLRALELFPNSPRINWEFANYLIRAGQAPASLARLQKAISGDPTLRGSAFDLAWRAGLPPDSILANIGSSSVTLSAYLDYLVQTARLDQARRVWDDLVAKPEPVDLDAAFRYFDALLYGHRLEVLTGLWEQLGRHEPARVHPVASQGNRIVNSGFEEPILNGGFDWRTPPIEGATIDLDSATVHSGARSLAVRFDGTRNVNFANVVEYVPVKPGTLYRLSVYLCADGITTDSGPQIAIYDAFDHALLSVHTESVLGSITWQERHLEFRTSSATKLIVLQVERHPSAKLDNQIAGTIWLDDLTLIEVE